MSPRPEEQLAGREDRVDQAHREGLLGGHDIAAVNELARASCTTLRINRCVPPKPGVMSNT